MPRYVIRPLLHGVEEGALTLARSTTMQLHSLPSDILKSCLGKVVVRDIRLDDMVDGAKRFNCSLAGAENAKRYFDRRRDRTCNLLIRSQAPCHWASRPVLNICASLIRF